MNKTKLNYTFVNPNSSETTAKYIAKLLVENSKSILDEIIEMESKENK